MSKDLTDIWGPFTWLQRQLLDWAQKYIFPVEAAQVARLTLAELFRLAFCAYSSEAGPYALAFETAGAYLAKKMVTTNDEWIPSMRPPSYEPTTIELYRLCDAYAKIYEVGYLANLSYPEREDIAILIRLYDLVPFTNEQIRTNLAFGDNNLAPLRRVVQVLDEHGQSSQLICIAACEVRDEEVDKSYAWLRRFQRQQEVQL